MEAQSARVICRRDKLASDGVHLRERAYVSRIAEIVGEDSAREARATGRLRAYDLVGRLATEHLSEKWSSEATEVRTASSAAYEYVRPDAVLVQGRRGLQAYYRLVQKHLVKHRPKHIAIALIAHRTFYRFRNRAAQRASRTGMLRKNAAAHLSRVGRRRNYGGAESADHLAAERLLLVGTFDHEDLAVKAEIAASHRKRSAPLPGTGLRGYALEALLFSVICLRYGRIELVRAGGVVAFELIENLRRCAERLFEEGGVDQRGRTVHFVEIENLLRDIYELCCVVEFLLYKFLTENRGEVLLPERLEGSGIEQSCGLLFHVSAQIVPFAGHLLF